MTRKFRKSLLTWAGILALFVSVQLFLNRGLVSGTPPTLQGSDLNGRPYAGLESLEKPGVVYFWASWCRVCRAMQGTVRELARDTPMITVALQSGAAAEVREYMKKQDFEVPVLLDEDGVIGNSWGLRGVPTAFILDREGKIRFATVGYTSGIGFRIRLWLAGF